jgi:hypothetical protein
MMRFNEGSVSAKMGLTPLFRRALALVALLSMTTLAGAQAPQIGQSQGATSGAIDAVSGTYKGTAKVDADSVPVTLELQSQSGKVSGQITVHEHVIKLAEGGSFKEGRLNVKASMEANEITIAGQVKDDTIVGTWTMGGKTGPIELKKVPAAASTPAAPTTTAMVTGDVFTGDWDAVADANGQQFPFSLTLKVEGEKVTGGSSSELGTSTIGTGTFKDGRVTFRLDGQAGAISMTATIQDGKLVGDFDYSGQMQGRWVAVRHKP